MILCFQRNFTVINIMNIYILMYKILFICFFYEENFTKHKKPKQDKTTNDNMNKL